MAQVDLFGLLQAAGVDQDSIVSLVSPATPRHIRYVDLLQAADKGSASTVLPDAVIEAAGSPIMYVVRQDRLGDSGDAPWRLAELVRALACRADARFSRCAAIRSALSPDPRRPPHGRIGDVHHQPALWYE